MHGPGQRRRAVLRAGCGMNIGESVDIQRILSYFLDPDGGIHDCDAMAAAIGLAERAYKQVGAGPTPNDVRDMFVELLEAVSEFDLDGREIEDVPVGDVL
jgi:hypothetical protein